MEIPSNVKGLENVNQLRLAEAVEMSNYGVEFIDHVVFLFRDERSVIDTNYRCPLGKSLVWTG